MADLELAEITAGDLLAELDTSVLYLLERRYLDAWPREMTSFHAPSRARLRWEDAFCGFRFTGMRYFGDAASGLAPQNMESFLGLFRDGSHSFLFAVNGLGGKIPELAFYAALRNAEKESDISSREYGQFLERGVRGNFPGAVIEPLEDSWHVNLADGLRRYAFAGLMTGIPGRKRHEEHFFAQGLERLVDLLAGQDFACLAVAEPYTVNEIVRFIDPVLSLKSELGQFKKYTISEQEGKSETTADTLTVGLSKTTSSSKTMMGPGGALISAASGVGAAIGTAVGPGVGALAGSAIGAAMAAVGTWVSGMPLSTAVSEALSVMGSYSKTRATTRTKMRGVSREIVNAAAEYATELLDQHIRRLRTGRSYGYWNVGFYCFAPDAATFTAVKNATISVFSGESSALEPIRFVDLKGGHNGAGGEQDGTNVLLNEIVAGFNPRIEVFRRLREAVADGVGVERDKTPPLGECYEGLTTPMTTSELAILVAPPQRECRALSVTQRAAFGGKTLAGDLGVKDERSALRLGQILYFGEPTSEDVRLPMSDFARHVFVTGITGSGKTNTVQSWCRQLRDARIPWMVLEASGKREYRHLGRDWDGAQAPLVFSLGTDGTAPFEQSSGVGLPFRMNPFFFPEHVHVLTHLDSLKAAFNAAFPMYASMPYILEEAIAEVYRDTGWNLASSKNRHIDNPWSPEAEPFLFPTLRDLYEKIDSVVERKRYDVRLRMDISAALRARLGSLLLGGKGAMLNAPVSLKFDSLRGRNVVLEMASMGSDEDKCLVMAFVITAIYEAAQAGPARTGETGPAHILVVEEAHRLLRNAAAADNPEIANIRGAAVEQFANMLAELRALGQGIIIVDQTPSKLVPDVIKNTALKCVHQLAAEDDRRAVGETMALEPAQQVELARLRPNRGEMVVYHQTWEKAYCLQVDRQDARPGDPAALRGMRDAYIAGHPQVYGVGGCLLGIDHPSISPEFRHDISRRLVGLAFNDVALFRSGFRRHEGSGALGLDAVLNAGRTPVAPSLTGESVDAFHSLLRDLLRIGNARMDLLAECPERFLRLLVEAATTRSIVDPLRELYRRLLDAIGLRQPEHALALAATRWHMRHSGVQERLRLPADVREFDDETFEEVHRAVSPEADVICEGGAIEKGCRSYLASLMLEHSLLALGAVGLERIVTEYNRRFL